MLSSTIACGRGTADLLLSLRCGKKSALASRDNGSSYFRQFLTLVDLAFVFAFPAPDHPDSLS